MKRRKLQTPIALLLTALVASPGCGLKRSDNFRFDRNLTPFYTEAAEISTPDVESVSYEEIGSVQAPLTLDADNPPEFWDLTLQEAIQRGLANSSVMRDLGALVLQAPQNVRTMFDPAINETDPRFGIEAALSAFDASFEAQAFFENNDRALNNVFFGGGTRILKQDLHNYQAQISKRAANGGEFTLRKIIDYDLNNQPGNDDPNKPWLVQMETEFRQPLLQGAGVDFNRIAGPDGRPGAMNGVLLSRISSDVSLAEFEISVRNLVSDIETLYWELAYAYRHLDAKIAARDRALETWRNVNALYKSDRRGGEAQKEARAREQFYQLEEEVQTALAGGIPDDNRYRSLRGSGGVYTIERHLRRMMGEPPTDGRLIRPADEPLMARVVFDWSEVLVEGLSRRAELRKQKWQIKRREMELAASRNFLLPTVDAIGRYRWRGLGHHLSNSERQADEFDNAIQNLTTGNFQEWQLGIEVQMPVGYRQGHAAVRNAELNLKRELAILDDQEKQVAHELSQAYAEVVRAYTVTQTSYNRRIAAMQSLEALENKRDSENTDEGEKNSLLDLLLDAQRRLSDAETEYYRGLLEYNLAVKNVHVQKGSLLDFNEVYLSEGPWPGKAYYDAARREESRRRPLKPLNYIMSVPFPISRGPHEQRIAPNDDLPMPLPVEEMPRTAPAVPEPVVPNPAPATNTESVMHQQPGTPRSVMYVPPSNAANITQGHSTQGHSTQGHSTQGHSTQGHSTQGHSTQGHSTQGHSTQGHSTQGHSTQGHSTQGHSTQGHSTQGHSTQGHSTQGHSMSGGNTESFMPVRPATTGNAVHDAAFVLPVEDNYGNVLAR